MPATDACWNPGRQHREYENMLMHTLKETSENRISCFGYYYGLETNFKIT